MKKEQEMEQFCCLGPEIGDLFIFYISGNVTQDERRRIEEHLTMCSECREEVRFFRELQKAGKELFGDE
jgi:anti-sigma factor RsiW